MASNSREEQATEAHARHLSITQLAERLGVPAGTIYQWNHRGIGPKYLRIGRHVRYRLADVEAWEATKVSRAA